MNLTLDEENVHKSFGLPEGIDPNHEYVYRAGEHGIYDFWYKDKFNNYWLYTNAPTDHKDYDPLSGEAMLVSDQPMPHTAPQFYTPEGRKLNSAVPQEAELIKNEAYDPLNPRSIWYAMYQNSGGETRYVYYDTDVRENLDLWIQHQLRIVDATLVKYRKYANKLFESPHPKDRVISTLLMLIDQGMFEAYELTQAKVEDVEYIDSTIKILGRKIVCDPVLLDFFTSLTANRDPSEPLFVLDTHMGRRPIGVRHIYSILRSLRISPHFLLYWHASHLFSRIVHRLAAEGVDANDVEVQALDELRRAIGIIEDVSALVDLRLKETLMRNYVPEEEDTLALPEDEPGGDEEEETNAVRGGEELNKGFVQADSDSFGVLTVWSDLVAKRPDEFQFSQWLHATPMHDVSDEEMVEAEQQLAEAEEASQAEQSPNESEEGAVSDPGSEGVSPSPAEGELPEVEEG